MFDLKPDVCCPTIPVDGLDVCPHPDCTQLQNLLAAQQWQDADEETRRLMLLVVGFSEHHYLSEREFLEFPHQSLCLIDRLWREHSGDRFGFSIQSLIWRQMGGWHPDANYDTWLRFGQQVGWLQGCWLSPSELDFNLQAPRGHLPAAWTAEFELGDIAVSLFSRIDGDNSC